jgi:hypothetical protein
MKFIRNVVLFGFLLALVGCPDTSQRIPDASQGISDAGPHRFGASSSTGIASTGTTQANGLVVKTTAGYIVSIYVYNTTASNVWAIMANQITIPSGFTTIIGIPVLIPASSAVVLGTDFFGTGGILFSTGISIGISTSEASYSAGGASFDILVNYI